MPPLKTIFMSALTMWTRYTTTGVEFPSTLELREQQRTAQVLSMTMLCTSILLISQMGIYSFDHNWASLLELVISECGIVWALHVNRRNATSKAATIYLVTVTLGGLAGILPDYASARFLDWIIAGFPILLCGLFLPSWTPFLFAGIDTGFAVCCAFNSILNKAFIPAMRDDIFLSTIGFIYGSLACIAALYAWNTNRAIQVAQQAEVLQELYAELENKNHLLQDTAEELTHTQTQLLAYTATLSDMNQQLEQLASYDHLTEIYNHREMAKQLTEALAEHRANRQAICILFLDIDHFKHINDTYGHSYGDEVLKEFVQVVKSQLRPTDILGRWGGEEFLVVAPISTKMDGIACGERIRRAVAAHRFPPPGTPVTCSIGVCASSGADAQETLIELADKAMYQAKQRGRNQVAVFESNVDLPKIA